MLTVALPLSGWLHDSAFKDAAAHPLKLFWIIPWFRIGAVASLDAAAKEQAHSILFAIHVWAGYALYVLVALHVAGALKHEWIDGTPELTRMKIRLKAD